MNEISNIDNAILQLRVLKKDIQKRNKLSDTAFNIASKGTRNATMKASTNLNWSCMNLDKQRKATWQAIKDADLEVSLEEREYNPSGFHSYKG